MVWFRRTTLATAAWCLVVVLLGAYVRLTAAGLGCPDWPTCYGHMTAAGALANETSVNAAYPDRPVDYGKAVKEMVHRYAAGALGVAIAFLAGWALLNRRDPQQPVRAPLLLLFVVAGQAALGMLTVTWLLKPLIVTLHLLGGMLTLALLWWIALPPAPMEDTLTLTLSRRERGQENSSGASSSPLPLGERLGVRVLLRKLAILGLIVLGVQIALGGWTSSNYAAVACPDFPLCQGRWWPETDFRDAFVLWRGLGIDYEGGVLDHPARVAIHLIHRIGALVLTAVVAILGFFAMARARSSGLRIAGVGVLLALMLQLLIGVAMVTEGFPLALATAHNGGAAVLLLAVTTLLRQLDPLPSGERVGVRGSSS